MAMTAKKNKLEKKKKKNETTDKQIQAISDEVKHGEWKEERKKGRKEYIYFYELNSNNNKSMQISILFVYCSCSMPWPQNRSNKIEKKGSTSCWVFWIGKSDNSNANGVYAPVKLDKNECSKPNPKRSLCQCIEQ